MNKRLQILMSHENISASKLANIMGVQPSAISHIISERNKPSYDFILKLLDSFPQYNIEWLLLGTGRMLKGEEAALSRQSYNATEPVMSLKEVADKPNHPSEIQATKQDDVIQEKDTPKSDLSNKLADTGHAIQSVSDNGLFGDNTENHNDINIKKDITTVPKLSDSGDGCTKPSVSYEDAASVSSGYNADSEKVSDNKINNMGMTDGNTTEKVCAVPSSEGIMKVMFIYEDKTFELYNPRTVQSK